MTLHVDFTPGPWSVDAMGNVWAKDTKVCEMASPPLQADVYRNKTEKEHKANARLISAGPELLAALTQCAALIKGTSEQEQKAISAAKKAFEKATGIHL